MGIHHRSLFLGAFRMACTNFPPMGLHNSQFIPANCKIGYSIETLRGRLARACECLGHTLGVLPPQDSEHHLRFTFVLEEGALTIPEMWKLHSSLSAWDDLTLVAHLHYTPAKQQGCFVVAGVVNHLLCDRRVIQCIFGLAEPYSHVHCFTSVTHAALPTALLVY